MKLVKTIEAFLGFILLLGCFVCSYIASSQSQISFRQLSVKEGLSQNSVVAVAQDSIGYLWIATQNGLNKYDGKKFTNYRFDFVDITKPTYSHLGKVYVDRKGNVFIIPLDRKVYKYDKNKDVFKPISQTENVSSLFHDKNDNYWIGTYNNGLLKFDENFEKSKIIIDKKNVPKTIYNISKIEENKILITTDKKLIEVNVNTNDFKIFEPETLLGEKIDQNFSTFIEDRNGRLWIGTFGDGLYFKESQSSTLYRFSGVEFTDPLPNDLNILDLHLDDKGHLWIATYGKGLFLIDFQLKKISHFTAEKYNPKAIHYNDILCIYEDYAGTIWFGTDGAGLSYFDESLEKFNSFTNLQTPENINIDVVRAITVNNKGNVWIGTSGKGLTEYEPSSNSWRTFTTINSGISSNRIMSLFVHEEDDLWIGTQGNGLVFYNEKTGFRESKGLSAKTIWNIFRDARGNTWLSTQNNGLVLFDKEKGTLKNYNTGNGLSSNNIRVVTEDDKNNLWIGTDDQGVIKLNTKTEQIKIYEKGNGENYLSGNGIKSLYFNGKNTLWIGTNGNGLNALDIDREKFYHYTEDNGLANNVIYAILPDDNKNLWLSSNKGITHFSISDSINNPIIKNYNNYAGLATEFNTGAYYKHSNGDLYYGGLEGFYWFNPNTIRKNESLPKTTITEFEVLNEAKPLVQGMGLKHNQNTLTFTFSSLQFALPEKNQYQYKLLNYDDDWIDAITNSVRYTRLPPGDYEFQVKSSNYDGLWNETPATFSFKIKAPWYFNTYSKLFYGIAILISLFGIYSYFKWRWKMKLDLQLQEQEAERLKQLNEYKSKLYTDVAHEFRTPLTLISAPIDAKLTEGNLSDFDYANFSGIKRNTNRLTNLVDQLLQLAKLEQGKQMLRLSKGDLGLFLNSIVEPFQYKAKTKEIDFKIDISKIEDVWYDEDIVEKIVSNLLSNAIKYTSEKGTCKFEAQTREGKLYLGVINSIEQGETIETEKLFDRFYQKNEYAQGAGVGLSLVKELVKLHNGKITAKTIQNEIIFETELSIDKDAFHSSKVELIENDKQKVDNKLQSSVDFGKVESKTDENPILLVVEDNEEVRMFISNSLKHKYQILEAANGQEGIEKAIMHVPDIVLSDVRMPNKNGIELCNTLKSDERTSHIPIILLTADTGEENELKGLESGADDFVTKPFKLRILEKRLDNLIQLRRALRDRYSQEYILKPTDISLTSTDEAFLNKLQDIIDTDFSNPDFNAVRFSKKIGMSRMQLHRKLLAYTGLSTSAFMRSQRLKQAIHILKTSDATINEVAYTVGFNTPSYFIKCFKETYKKTPSEYLQSTDK